MGVPSVNSKRKSNTLGGFVRLTSGAHLHRVGRCVENVLENSPEARGKDAGKSPGGSHVSTAYGAIYVQCSGLILGLSYGRYWIRTSDLLLVRQAL